MVNSSISIIIPTYNAEKIIVELVHRIHVAMTKRRIPYEIIIVDDHSTDRTKKILKLVSKYYPVHLYIKRGEKGTPYSLIEGSSYAKHDSVCLISADIQNPSKIIPQLIEKIKGGVDDQSEIRLFKKAELKTEEFLRHSQSSYHHGSSKHTQLVYSAFALACVASFAIWWFQPDHVPKNFIGTSKMFDFLLFALVSFVIWHPVIMDVLTWVVSSHIKDIPKQKPKSGLKVAFITTIVPASESLDLLHKCLPAMVNAKYPHDTWLLDEGNNPEVKKICEQYGVKHFSRFGIRAYNTPKGKFTKTKGGNHNSWYEIYGNRYDIVAQIDTDFVPKRTFLTKTLGYFKDPKVAFVGTPQIYGNTQNSLIAQGAAEQLYTFYGSILRGLSSMNMTLLIGANHVIRVAALKQVNHYSAHITEDLITGMKLHTQGWKSIYLSQPLAIGEGPNTWEAYFNQQMRWAYGCVDILFHHSPKLFTKMGLRRAIYYFFLQQHYFSGIAMALSIFLLSLYFFAGLRAADIDLFKFFAFYSFTLLLCWLMSVWLQRYNIHRKNEGELLLAGKIISIAAWPVWFMAFFSVLTGRRLTYKVTPKGENDSQQKTSIGIFIPHMIFGLITIAGLISSFFTHRQSTGMMFWAYSSAILMLCVPFSQDIARGLTKIRRNISKSMQNIYRRIKKIKSPELISKSSSLQQTRSSASDSPHTQGIIKDSLFLSFVVLTSLVLYVHKLGFYSDDWAFLGNFSLSSDQSLLGLFKTATTPNTFMRPVQNFYDALLYWIFGITPLGYQLVNAAVLIALTLMFYAILRQLKLPRIIAIAVPMIYALLPNYSTDRFWYAVFQANLSILLYFFSLFAALRALSLNTVKKSVWKILSIVSLLLSALSYEVVLPLYLLNALILWNPIKRLSLKSYRKKMPHPPPTIFILLIFISLLYVFIFKAMTTTRLETIQDSGYYIHIITSAIQVNYGTWILNLPHIWGQILSLYASPTILTFGFVLYMVVFWYLYYVASKPNSNFPSASWMGNLTLLSFVIFFLGYVIFFTNNQVGFSPTGIDNRVAIAAAIGVAFSIVGGIGWICRILLPEKIAKVFFCLFISIMSAGSFLIINTLATFWIDAHKQGQAVLADIHQNFSNFPKNSTFILDGICPYVGPAPVFEAEWDLKGALQTYYNDPTLRADIVTPRLKIKEEGIYTQIYTFPAGYPYKNLFIYNFNDKSIHSIPNAQAATTYFQQYNPDRTNGCPEGSAGKGVAVF